MTAKVLSAPPTAGVDIALVHGWHGQTTAWTGESGVFWPEKILPGLVPQARIIAFNYTVEIEKFWEPEAKTYLNSVSDDLVWALDDVRSATETTGRPLIFVAHSIGGVVCQNFLGKARSGSREHQQLEKCARRLILIGTPFHTDTARWAETGEKFFKLCGKCEAASDLQRADKLVEIGEKFSTFLESRKEPGAFEIASFYEEVPTQIRGELVKVTDESAVRIPNCPDPSSLGATHQAMVQVSSAEDDHFKRISRRLSKWTKELGEPKGGDEEAPNVYNSTFNGENRHGVQIGNNMGTISSIALQGPGSHGKV